MCVGDFNEVLHQHEHVGVQEHSRAQIAGFREMVGVCGFCDLGYEGRSWTFEKKVAGGVYCRVRLDRGLATADWSSRFPDATVKNMSAVASDHGPILLEWRPANRPSQRGRRFRYEQMWETHPDFSETLAGSWRKEGVATSVWELKSKLKEVSNHLVRWDRSAFGHVRAELRKLNEELDHMQQDPQRLGPSHMELKVMERIQELNHREELMWRQRSRVTWLAAGDKNTRFFHLRASNRRRRNKITRLKNTAGQFIEEESELKSLGSQFYEDLYTSEGTVDMDRVLSAVPRKVSEEMNSVLITPFVEEVKHALFQMFPTKAPGPDGFPAHFFQRHWDLYGEEVTAMVLRVLRGEEEATNINETLIVLIPKVASPEEVGQFRPISLCNVLYKIASKVLANRLKTVLPEIIFEEQSAFVPGRLITDNIITAYECLHFMKQSRLIRNVMR